MKKIISIIALLAACAAMTACNKTYESADRFAGLELFRPAANDRVVVFTNLSSLENACDLVVVGKFADDPVQTEYYFDPDNKKFLYNVISTCPIEISRVIKGDIETGDKINVLQRYGIVDDRLIVFDELTPMQKGDEWLFFLKYHSPLDGYWCWGDTDARYPTKNSSENAPMPLSDSPDIGVYNEENFNREIYNEIIEKYDI